MIDPDDQIPCSFLQASQMQALNFSFMKPPMSLEESSSFGRKNKQDYSFSSREVKQKAKGLMELEQFVLTESKPVKLYLRWENKDIENDQVIGPGDIIQVRVDIHRDITVRDTLRLAIERFNSKFQQMQARIRFNEDPEMFLLFAPLERNIFKEDLKCNSSFFDDLSECLVVDRSIDFSMDNTLLVEIASYAFLGIKNVSPESLREEILDDSNITVNGSYKKSFFHTGLTDSVIHFDSSPKRSKWSKITSCFFECFKLLKNPKRLSRQRISAPILNSSTQASTS